MTEAERIMKIEAEKIKVISRVLRLNFPNATKYKLIHVACTILEQLDAHPPDKVPEEPK